MLARAISALVNQLEQLASGKWEHSRRRADEADGGPDKPDGDEDYDDKLHRNEREDMLFFGKVTIVGGETDAQDSDDERQRRKDQDYDVEKAGNVDYGDLGQNRISKRKDAEGSDSDADADDERPKMPVESLEDLLNHVRELESLVRNSLKGDFRKQLPAIVEPVSRIVEEVKQAAGNGPRDAWWTDPGKQLLVRPLVKQAKDLRRQLNAAQKTALLGLHLTDEVLQKDTKLSTILEEVRDHFSENAADEMPIVIASCFARTLYAIRGLLESRGFEGKVELLTGDLSTKKRAETIARFQQGEIPVLLLSQKCGSEGISLVRAHEMILVDVDYTPAQLTQVTARIHRMGQTNPCRVRRLLMDKSIEECLLRTRLWKKKRAAADILGDKLEEPGEGELAAMPVEESEELGDDSDTASESGDVGDWKTEDGGSEAGSEAEEADGEHPATDEEDDSSRGEGESDGFEGSNLAALENVNRSLASDVWWTFKPLWDAKKDAEEGDAEGAEAGGDGSDSEAISEGED